MGIRQIRLQDAEKLLTFFEKLVKSDPERVERIEDVKSLDVQKEGKWIAHRLAQAQKQEMFALVAETEGEIVAIEAVKKAGYREVGRVEGYYKREGDYIDRIYMAKRLSK